MKKAGATANDADPMSAEINSLMLRAKRGDQGAFTELVARLRARAFRVAHSLVGSREDAMDLAQETFLKVFRARDTFRDGEPFLPWFHRILRNTCFSHLRQKGRLKQVSVSAMSAEDDDADYELIDEGAPQPGDRLVAEERAAAFHEGLRQLSAKDREILVLRHEEDLSYREIADALGIPQGTVMSRLFHARRRLRERLRASLGEPELDEGAAKP
ncbi:MAG: RNA polymerase sigma factor [Planctomycetes bacterium]|nr:RNA polymerase sigma factor [Planctomycetota bacterium]